MDFDLSERQRHWRDRIVAFTEKYIEPAEATYHKQEKEGDRWKVIPVLDELKKKARAEGLWNMFMPPNDHEDDEFRGAGLSNLEYSLLAEHMGRIKFAPEAFNCSAPDTGNMEVFIRYANREQKRKWLRRLMDGEIRSAFLMTEPAVASSDATNIETRIEEEGRSLRHQRPQVVVVGRRRSALQDRDPDGQDQPGQCAHQQQSQILVPLDTPGITVERCCRCSAMTTRRTATPGAAQGRQGAGREPAARRRPRLRIAQGRLGPGRIHHCMRTIGVAEVALEKMISA